MFLTLLKEQSFDHHRESELLSYRWKGVHSYEAAFELKGAVVLPALEVVLALHLKFSNSQDNLSASDLDGHKICKYLAARD